MSGNVQNAATRSSEAFSLLEAAVNTLSEGFAVWNSDLKLVFYNEKFKELAWPPGYSAPELGQDAAEFGIQFAETGYWQIPSGMDKAAFAASIPELLKSNAQSLQLTRADGRSVLASTHKTEPAGHVLTFVDTATEATAERHVPEMLVDAIESLDDGFCLWDRDMKLLTCNQKYTELVLPLRNTPIFSGTAADEVVREAIRSDLASFLSEPPEHQIAADTLAWLKGGGSPLEFVDGTGRVVELKAKTTSLGSSIVTATDVTADKRVEPAEVHELAMVNDAVEAISEGFSLWSKDLKFILCNEKYMEILFPPGFPRLQPGDDAVELNLRNLATGHIPIPDGADLDQYATQILDWAKSYGQNLRMKLADGRTILASSNRTNLGGYLLTVRDITKELDSEQKARDMLFDAFQTLDEGLVLLDEDMTVIFGNDAWHKMMFDRPDRIPPKPGESALDNFKALVKTGFYAIPSHMTEDDFIAWMMGEMAQHGKQVPYRAADGRHFVGSSHLTAFGGSLLFIRDVTETRGAEEKRHEAVTDAIQATSEALVLFDKDSKFVLANKAWLDGFFSDREPPAVGADGAEMFRAVIEEGYYVIPKDLTPQTFFEKNMAAYYAYDKNIELRAADGRILLGSSHQTGLGGFLLSFRDVTEVRRAQETLLESVTAALQSLTDGIALFDANFDFIVGNSRYLEMWYPGEIADPYPGENIEEITRRVVSAGHMRLPPGVGVDEMCDRLVELARGFAKNVPLQTKDRNYLASAHQTSLGGYLLECTDITERLRAEEALAREKEISHQNEKLSALGELLAGVAHELNNPLSVIFGYSQMLEGYVEDPKVSERIELIRQAAERSAKIVRTFLAMARQRPAKVELCSLNSAVQTAIEVSTYSLTTNGTQVILELDPNIPAVMGDFDQLAQVFTNLIVNAGQALAQQRENGQLTIRSSFRADLNEVSAEVHDNGPGIPRDVQRRIFEPFFTTKDVGEGTGVGLAFSHRIIKSHNGVLELSSAETTGTSFFVRLSAVSADYVYGSEPLSPPNAIGQFSVLVVDDEADVARLTSDLLSEAGYVVTQTTDPREALSILDRQSFDVIISDFKMPGLDGETFYNELSEIAPECAKRVGFITGDAMSSRVQNFLVHTGCPFIEKPIIRGELLNMLHRMIDSSRAVS